MRSFQTTETAMLLSVILKLSVIQCLQDFIELFLLSLLQRYFHLNFYFTKSVSAHISQSNLLFLHIICLTVEDVYSTNALLGCAAYAKVVHLTYLHNLPNMWY